MATGTLVTYDLVDGAIAVLTFNRPEKMNALSTALLAEFEAHLQAIERDPAVRVVILTGAGGKAFVAGADNTASRVSRPL